MKNKQKEWHPATKPYRYVSVSKHHSLGKIVQNKLVLFVQNKFVMFLSKLSLSCFLVKSFFGKFLAGIVPKKICICFFATSKLMRKQTYFP